MRSTLVTGIAFSLSLLAGVAQAQEHAKPEEAIAMVKKAITLIQSAGTEKAYAEISNRQGSLVDRDLYVVVYDLNGNCLAHGSNAKLVGKSLIDAQDVDGVYYVKNRVELAKNNSSFWQNYKFTNPESKKIEPKKMYCEVVANVAVCSGVYL